MKKLIALLLALAMAFALVACGSSSSAPAGDTTAPAGDSAPAGDAGFADVDPLTITFSSTYQETETGGIIQKHFIDYLDQITDGKITVDITWGGTLYDSNGELKAVQDGIVDMIAFGHMPHLDTVPYMSMPGFAPGGTKAALDYFDILMFQDPETSALIQGEAEELGIKYLNVIAGGANAFCASFEYTDLDDMVAKCGSFGNFDAAIFEYLGFQVTPVMPPDCYDALNRGLIQATQMGLAPMVSMAWYEVAPWWSLDGTYTGGNFFTVNLDWWNGLTDGQRAAIEDACAEVENYSAGMYDDAIADDLDTITSHGGTIVELSQADMDKVWEATFIAKANDAMARAERNGKTEGMTVILEKAAEITGFDWEH
ncbi:MAG: TRAP transporter substrate-binding protein DctP [Oscillospiraceae bacterium]|nr:TRAP transporter substrate-binding protein DctP [Oscillospiraceae bacterium]